MSRQSTRHTDERAGARGELVHVNATVLVGRPATIVPVPETESEEFTRQSFEDALDKVSRDEADVADARVALREEGDVPWEEVKRKHGL